MAASPRANVLVGDDEAPLCSLAERAFPLESSAWSAPRRAAARVRTRRGGGE